MSTLLTKLKEGLQDAVVFLRTLEQFRIPPVVERRRKELLERLLALQGDTLRDTPPCFEPPDEEETKQPVRTDSKRKVGGLVKGIEETDTGSKTKEAKSQKSVKSEEEPKAPKDDKVSGGKGEESKESSSKNNDLEKKVENELKPEQPAVSGSSESLNKLDEKEKKRGLGFRFKRSKAKDKEKQQVTSPGRTESPAVDEGQKDGPSKEEPSKEEAPEEPPKEEADEEKETATQEENGKVEFQLERRVPKRFGGHQWQKQTVTLKDFTLCIGPKDKVDLVGCTIASTDNGFELYSHPERKTFMFKGPSDEVKDKCISTLQAAIDECTPAPSETPEQPDKEVSAEGKQADVPKITVEVEEEPSAVYVNEEVQPSEPEPQVKKKKESKAAPVAKVRKLPDQGVQMKGYVYRKMWRGWEKCWCVLTFNAMYFTGVEENAEYSHMLSINPEEGGGSIKEKNGRDRQSKGMMIKTSKKSKAETISVESSEFSQWYRQLEKVIGISGVEELLSEDEEEGGEGIDEELYEEVDLPPPPVPASPRPQHHPIVSPSAVSEDFQDMAGEDIYEDFDDLPDTIPESDSPQHNVPALPQRNLKSAEPPPALPARNVPPTKVSNSPVLPPRNIASPARNIPKTGGSSPIPSRDSDPVDYEIASPPRAKVGIPARPPPPPTASTARSPPTAPTNDDDTYDDIVGVMGQEEIEEAYDDVVMPTAGVNSPPPEENYEDMAPGEEGQEYVVMEHGQEEGEEGELYVEVEEDKPPAPAQRKSLAEQPKQPPPRAGTFSKFFGGGKAKATAEAGATSTKSHSGHLSCKPPKKSKFTEEWCVLDGSTLQFYRNPSDRKPREKLALGDHSLKVGSTEAGAGEFSFQLSKGDKVHHFNGKTKEDVEGWISALKVVVKSAAIEPGDRKSTVIEPGDRKSAAIEPGDRKSAAMEHMDQVFQAKEDHIGEGEDQLTFKKGTFIRLITQMSGDLWIGQIGNEAQVFNGKIGKFPIDKVVPADDLYI